MKMRLHILLILLVGLFVISMTSCDRDGKDIDSMKQQLVGPEWTMPWTAHFYRDPQIMTHFFNATISGYVQMKYNSIRFHSDGSYVLTATGPIFGHGIFVFTRRTTDGKEIRGILLRQCIHSF